MIARILECGELSLGAILMIRKPPFKEREAYAIVPDVRT
jgi:hypothetical protein